jgi:iron(III) transport system substrate-binding protein
MFNKLVLAAGIVSMTLTPAVLAADEVNIYSARKEALIKPLLDKFSAQTGINVRLATGSAEALQKKLELEGENSPADLLVTTDAGNLHRAAAAGLLQAVESETLTKAIPENLRDKDNQWFGLTYRARPIFYVKDKVKPEELSTYEALADEKWQGRICIRSSDNIYNQSLTASMLAADGAEKTQQWAEGLVKNLARPPKGGDRDQIKAAAAGQCDLAVANSYYYAGMLTGNDEEQKDAAAKVAIFWPNQDDRGTHINVSGIALTQSAKNKDNAVKLMEFMVSEEAQRWYAETNGEYPVVADVAPSELLNSWGTFKADALNLSVLGENNAEAVRIMDKAGWK